MRKTRSNPPRSQVRWLLILLLAALPWLGGCARRDVEAWPAGPVADALPREIARTVDIGGRVVAAPGSLVELSSPGVAVVDRVDTHQGDEVRAGEPLLSLDFGSADNLREQSVVAQWEAREALGAIHERSRSLRDPAMERVARARAAVEAGKSAANTAERWDAEAALAAVEQQVTVAVLPAQWRLDLAERAVLAAREGARRLIVEAPLDGRVRLLGALPGKVAHPGVPLVRILDVSELQVEAPVGFDTAGALQPGMEAQLRFPEVPGRTLEGKVEEVAGTSTQEAYVVRLSFRNAEADVEPGMAVQVSVKLESRESALAIPEEAVSQAADGRAVVLAQRGGEWRPVEVGLGLSDGHFVEVHSGLREGERVLLPHVEVAADVRPGELR